MARFYVFRLYIARIECIQVVYSTGCIFSGCIWNGLYLSRLYIARVVCIQVVYSTGCMYLGSI